MIGDKNEIQTKIELQGLLDKLKRNVEGVGGLENLTSKYNTAYNNLMFEILNKTKAYMQSSLDYIQINVKCDDIQNMWGTNGVKIKKAIFNYSSDEIQHIMKTFIANLIVTYKENIIIGYENNEESLST